MAFLVSSPGSCGEFIQGYGEHTSFMVTCPINRYAVAMVDNKEKTMLPQKAEMAMKKTLTYLGEETLDGTVHLMSMIPKGKGLASSTADISAVAQAVALHKGRKLSMEEIAHIALSIEPSDATFFQGIVQFDYRHGKLIRSLGICPAMDILIYDCGGEVDTMAFNSRRDLIALQKSNQKEIEKAMSLFIQGIEEGSLKILHKKQLPAFYEVGQKCGAKGVICAHSGTVLGLILSPGMDEKPVRQALEKEIPSISYLDYVSLTNRGMQIEVVG